MAPRRKSSLARANQPEIKDGTTAGDKSPQQQAPQKTKISLVATDPELDAFLNVQIQPLAPEADKGVNHIETTSKVASAMESLGSLESAVISAIFPSDGSAPQSFEQVAAKLGMTVDEVKGLADNALRGLRGSKSLTPRLSTVWN
jgi:DNA-directed RNA polymerase sigma subunit (sigma70/sigma32)